MLIPHQANCFLPLIYSPEASAKINFKKINPTKYFVEINGADDPYTLVLSENYHQGWKALLDNQSLPDKRHFLAQEFANGWHIIPKDSGGIKNYILIIEYWPQRLFYIGAIISILTMAFCIIYGLKKSIK